VAWTGSDLKDVSASALILGNLSTCLETDTALWDENIVANIPTE
jgi:hypothetical protein